MVAMGNKKELAVAKKLGKELLLSRAHVNNAPLLLATLNSSSNLPVLKEALLSLEAFFIPLVRSGEYSPAAQRKASDALLEKGDDETDKAELIYMKWIWDRYRAFVNILLRFVVRNSMPEIQKSAVHAIMELVRIEVREEFNNQLYLRLCSTLVCSKAFDSELLSVIVSEYFKYLDVCYYTYSNMESIVVTRLSKKAAGTEAISSDDEDGGIRKASSLHAMVRNMYDVLINLPPLSQENADAPTEVWSLSSEGGDKKSSETSQCYKDEKKQRKRVGEAWLAFLRLPLPSDVYKKVLSQLHKRVIPFIPNPILLSDFLTNSYNVGGLISVMALNGLFILITKHGLEYPDFYNKLYALLEPSIFVAKHRARFFELVDTCLKSTHIPAYLAAAFAKKLGRLALSAPPAGALVVIAMIHNLLRRHPSINHLVQGDTAAITTLEAKRGADPFLSSETDTAKCNALKSSLWEIDTLRNHYCPAVSRFVASLETDLTVRAKTTEVSISDFSSGSYTTIFTEEVSKRLKAVPLAFYQSIPSSLFSEKTEDFVGWNFNDSLSAEKSFGAGLDNTAGQGEPAKTSNMGDKVVSSPKTKRQANGGSAPEADESLPLSKKKKN